MLLLPFTSISNLIKSIFQKSTDFDKMNGTQFEEYCREILKQRQFSNLEITQDSGRQGIDIIGYDDSKRVGFQCKKCSEEVGYQVVLGAYTGQVHYHLDEVYIITNSFFTKSAKELAKTTGIQLLDRTRLSNIDKQNRNTKIKNKNRNSEFLKLESKKQDEMILNAIRMGITDHRELTGRFNISIDHLNEIIPRILFKSELEMILISCHSVFEDDLIRLRNAIDAQSIVFNEFQLSHFNFDEKKTQINQGLASDDMTYRLLSHQILLILNRLFLLSNYLKENKMDLAIEICEELIIEFDIAITLQNNGIPSEMNQK